MTTSRLNRARTLRFVLATAIGVFLLRGGEARIVAQEGHPLKGSWIGTWGPNRNQGNDLLLVLNWDGKSISGTINPGTDNIPVKNATLQPDGWVVHLEADTKDKAGKAITYVLEGKIGNLPLPNRTLSGTWKNQEESGAFKLSRQ